MIIEENGMTLKYGISKDNKTENQIEYFKIKKGSRLIIYGQINAHGNYVYPLEIELLEDANAEYLDAKVKIRPIDLEKSNQKNLTAWKKENTKWEQEEKKRLLASIKALEKVLEGTRQRLKELDK